MQKPEYTQLEYSHVDCRVTVFPYEHKQFVLTSNAHALQYRRLLTISVQKVSNTYGIIKVELLYLSMPQATAAPLKLSGLTVASH